MSRMTKTAGAAGDFTAHDAARTLNQLENYEESLTLRGSALSWMAFGLGGAAIFVTYEAASQLFFDLGIPWLLALLWAPWILGASILTNGLWQMLSVTSNIPHDTKETVTGTVGGTALVFAIALLLWGISRVAGLEVMFDGSTGWALVIGAFTAILATYQSKRFRIPALRTPFVLAGLLIFLTGAAMAAVHTPLGLSGLIASGTMLLGYFGAGLYVYTRG